MGALVALCAAFLLHQAAPAASQTSGAATTGQPAEEKPAGPTIRAGSDGFRVTSGDGKFSLRLRGYLHFDGRSFESDAPGTDTFVLRRMRPILEATLWDRFDVRVMPDFGGGQTLLQDAYVDVRFSPALRLRLGKAKAPFGLERLQSATAISFVERALPTLLVPNRDLGVQLLGDLAGKRGSWAVMVSNGVPDGGSIDTDTEDGKDVTARVLFTPFAQSEASPLRQLGFGLAASAGDQESSPTSPGLPSWRTSGQQSFFAYRTSTTGGDAAFADGERTRLSPQAHFYRGPFGILAEHVTSSQEVRRGDVAADLEHQAWQVAAHWVFGGDASHGTVVPRRSFDAQEGAWGAWKVAARYAELDLDRDTFPLFANPATAAGGAKQWTIGATWHVDRNFALLLSYDHTEFRGGAAGGDRADEDVILGRAQLSF